MDELDALQASNLALDARSRALTSEVRRWAPSTLPNPPTTTTNSNLNMDLPPDSGALSRPPRAVWEQQGMLRGPGALTPVVPPLLPLRNGSSNAVGADRIFTGGASTPPAYTSQAASIRLQDLASTRQTTPSRSVAESSPPLEFRILGFNIAETEDEDHSERLEPSTQSQLAEMANLHRSWPTEVMDSSSSRETEVVDMSWSDSQQGHLEAGRLNANGEEIEISRTDEIDLSPPSSIGR